MWRAVIFCEACSDEPCFEGGSLTLPTEFFSKRAAERAAEAYIGDMDWVFEVYKP